MSRRWSWAALCYGVALIGIGLSCTGASLLVGVIGGGFIALAHGWNLWSAGRRSSR